MSATCLQTVLTAGGGRFRGRTGVARAEARLLKDAEAEKEEEPRAKRAAKMAKFKGNTVEELTGAAAGAAIDRMMEEIPQMRFWCVMLSLTRFPCAGGETV